MQHIRKSVKGNKLVNTLVIPVDPHQPDPQIIARAARILLDRGLVAFPTETVYGLGANALDEIAVGRIFSAKGRPFSDPLIVHIADLAQLEGVARDIPSIAYQLAQAFWPGPLTLVLKKHACVADKVSTGLETVAVRVPDHQVPLDLIRAAGVPLAAPSANLFTRPSPTSAQHVVDDLSGQVDLILDAGPSAIGLESTVLDLTHSVPAILRPGGTTAEALRSLLPHLDLPNVRSEPQGQATLPSPGMLLKHYSPRARFILYTGSEAAIQTHTIAVIHGLLRAGLTVGIMAVDEEIPFFKNLPVQIENLGSRNDLDAIGRVLFAKMRSLDARGVDIILMRSIQAGGLGLAIHDRLSKAAHQHVINMDNQLQQIIEDLISPIP